MTLAVLDELVGACALLDGSGKWVPNATKAQEVVGKVHAATSPDALNAALEACSAAEALEAAAAPEGGLGAAEGAELVDELLGAVWHARAAGGGGEGRGLLAGIELWQDGGAPGDAPAPTPRPSVPESALRSAFACASLAVLGEPGTLGAARRDALLERWPELSVPWDAHARGPTRLDGEGALAALEALLAEGRRLSALDGLVAGRLASAVEERLTEPADGVFACRAAAALSRVGAAAATAAAGSRSPDPSPVETASRALVALLSLSSASWAGADARGGAAEGAVRLTLTIALAARGETSPSEAVADAWADLARLARLAGLLEHDSGPPARLAPVPLTVENLETLLKAGGDRLRGRALLALAAAVTSAPGGPRALLDDLAALTDSAGDGAGARAAGPPPVEGSALFVVPAQRETAELSALGGGGLRLLAIRLFAAGEAAADPGALRAADSGGRAVSAGSAGGDDLGGALSEAAVAAERLAGGQLDVSVALVGLAAAAVSRAARAAGSALSAGDPAPLLVLLHSRALADGLAALAAAGPGAAALAARLEDSELPTLAAALALLLRARAASRAGRRAWLDALLSAAWRAAHSRAAAGGGNRGDSEGGGSAGALARALRLALGREEGAPGAGTGDGGLGGGAGSPALSRGTLAEWLAGEDAWLASLGACLGALEGYASPPGVGPPPPPEALIAEAQAVVAAAQKTSRSRDAAAAALWSEAADRAGRWPELLPALVDAHAVGADLAVFARTYEGRGEGVPHLALEVARGLGVSLTLPGGELAGAGGPAAPPPPPTSAPLVPASLRNVRATLEVDEAHAAGARHTWGRVLAGVPAWVARREAGARPGAGAGTAGGGPPDLIDLGHEEDEGRAREAVGRVGAPGGMPSREAAGADGAAAPPAVPSRPSPTPPPAPPSPPPGLAAEGEAASRRAAAFREALEDARAELVFWTQAAGKRTSAAGEGESVDEQPDALRGLCSSLVTAEEALPAGPRAPEAGSRTGGADAEPGATPWEVFDQDPGVPASPSPAGIPAVRERTAELDPAVASAGRHLAVLRALLSGPDRGQAAPFLLATVGSALSDGSAPPSAARALGRLLCEAAGTADLELAHPERRRLAAKLIDLAERAGDVAGRGELPLRAGRGGGDGAADLGGHATGSVPPEVALDATVALLGVAESATDSRWDEVAEALPLALHAALASRPPLAARHLAPFDGEQLALGLLTAGDDERERRRRAESEDELRALRESAAEPGGPGRGAGGAGRPDRGPEAAADARPGAVLTLALRAAEAAAGLREREEAEPWTPAQDVLRASTLASALAASLLSGAAALAPRLLPAALAVALRAPAPARAETLRALARVPADHIDAAGLTHVLSEAALAVAPAPAAGAAPTRAAGQAPGRAECEAVLEALGAALRGEGARLALAAVPAEDWLAEPGAETWAPTMRRPGSAAPPGAELGARFSRPLSAARGPEPGPASPAGPSTLASPTPAGPSAPASPTPAGPSAPASPSPAGAPPTPARPATPGALRRPGAPLADSPRTPAAVETFALPSPPRGALVSALAAAAGALLRAAVERGDGALASGVTQALALGPATATGGPARAAWALYARGLRRPLSAPEASRAGSAAREAFSSTWASGPWRGAGDLLEGDERARLAFARSLAAGLLSDDGAAEAVLARADVELALAVAASGEPRLCAELSLLALRAGLALAPPRRPRWLSMLWEAPSGGGADGSVGASPAPAGLARLLASADWEVVGSRLLGGGEPWLLRPALLPAGPAGRPTAAELEAALVGASLGLSAGALDAGGEGARRAAAAALARLAAASVAIGEDAGAGGPGQLRALEVLSCWRLSADGSEAVVRRALAPLLARDASGGEGGAPARTETWGSAPVLVAEEGPGETGEGPALLSPTFPAILDARPAAVLAEVEHVEAAAAAAAAAATSAAPTPDAVPASAALAASASPLTLWLHRAPPLGPPPASAAGDGARPGHAAAATPANLAAAIAGALPWGDGSTLFFAASGPTGGSPRADHDAFERVAEALEEASERVSEALRAGVHRLGVGKRRDEGEGELPGDEVAAGSEGELRALRLRLSTSLADAVGAGSPEGEALAAAVGGLLEAGDGDGAGGAGADEAAAARPPPPSTGVVAAPSPEASRPPPPARAPAALLGEALARAAAERGGREAAARALAAIVPQPDGGPDSIEPAARALALATAASREGAWAVSAAALERARAASLVTDRWPWADLAAGAVGAARVAAEAAPSPGSRAGGAPGVALVWLAALAWVEDDRWPRLPAGPHSAALAQLLATLDGRVAAIKPRRRLHRRGGAGGSGSWGGSGNWGAFSLHDLVHPGGVPSPRASGAGVAASAGLPTIPQSSSTSELGAEAPQTDPQPLLGKLRKALRIRDDREAVGTGLPPSHGLRASAARGEPIDLDLPGPAAFAAGEVAAPGPALGGVGTVPPWSPAAGGGGGSEGSGGPGPQGPAKVQLADRFRKARKSVAAAAHKLVSEIEDVGGKVGRKMARGEGDPGAGEPSRESAGAESDGAVAAAAAAAAAPPGDRAPHSARDDARARTALAAFAVAAYVRLVLRPVVLRSARTSRDTSVPGSPVDDALLLAAVGGDQFGAEGAGPPAPLTARGTAHFPPPGPSALGPGARAGKAPVPAPGATGPAPAGGAHPAVLVPRASSGPGPAHRHARSMSEASLRLEDVQLLTELDSVVEARTELDELDLLGQSREVLADQSRYAGLLSFIPTALLERVSLPEFQAGVVAGLLGREGDLALAALGRARPGGP